MAVYRKGHVFYKYFSDRQYNGEENSLKAALELRERVLTELELDPDNYIAIFKKFREETK